MQLTKKALTKIDRKTRQKLALALGFSEYWVSRLVKINKKNGPLTTPSALGVLRQETGLKDKELLQASEPVA